MSIKHRFQLQDILLPAILWATLVGNSGISTLDKSAIAQAADLSQKPLLAQAQNTSSGSNASSRVAPGAIAGLGVGIVGIGGLLWWLLKGRQNGSESVREVAPASTASEPTPGEPTTVTPISAAPTPVENESPALTLDASPVAATLPEPQIEPEAPSATIASSAESPAPMVEPAPAEEPPTNIGDLPLITELQTPFVPMTPPATGVALDQAQSDVEAAKFDVGQTDLSSESLAAVDEGLPELPGGYGISRIVLMPRDPHWAYAYWDVSHDHKQELRQQGGLRLALRLYDVTDINLADQKPHSLQQYDCDEMARDWYVTIPISDRDYVAEIGYVTADGSWLLLARSSAVRVPPVYPSDWFSDQFLTVTWDTTLTGQKLVDLGVPHQLGSTENPIYTQVFDLAQSQEIQRVAASLFGSMHQVPRDSISSFIFPSGAGMGAVPTVSGLTMSGVGMSGIGMSGIGFAASIPPVRPRQFWLVADAELIVYGATEPDALVTAKGAPIQLQPDGTFRFQMAFPDGLIDYPILAVAQDGAQTRSIHMRFHRETPHRNTNTKEEATDEWLF